MTASWPSSTAPPTAPHNVYVAKADGSGARVIAKCMWGTCERGFPAWSPDSKSLATTADLGKPDLARDRPPPVFAIGIIDVATQLGPPHRQAPVAPVAAGAATMAPGWAQAGVLRLACRQGPPVRGEP